MARRAYAPPLRVGTAILVGDEAYGLQLLLLLVMRRWGVSLAGGMMGMEIGGRVLVLVLVLEMLASHGWWYNGSRPIGTTTTTTSRSPQGE